VVPVTPDPNVGSPMTRTHIKNGFVVTMNFTRDIISGGFVVIEGETVERVGARSESPTDAIYERVLDADGMIVVPGLINTHQHFY